MEWLIRTRSTIAAATIAVSLVANTAVEAQLQQPRHYDVPTIVGGNAVIGGVTAAIQAAAAGRPVAKAFLTGALGGAVHGYGKVFSPDLGLGGMALGAVGTSIVANAGRGAPLYDELVLPVGPGRVRISQTGRVNVALNAFDGAMLARRLMQRGTRMDWSRSLQAGTVVLTTPERLMVGNGLRAAGITSGTTILLSDRASNPERTFKHERIHVQQAWFVHEVLGRPLEMSLRKRVPMLRVIPRWLELGVLMPTAQELERLTIGTTGPLRSWRETEAESLEGRTRP